MYLHSKHTWGARHAGVLWARPVAYFSAEFGIHESLPIYSGGLGILAGDHIKSASDLGIPLVGVGLYYDQGYFRQRLDRDGWQHEDYIDVDHRSLPSRPALSQGVPVTISVETRTGTIAARVWQLSVGRNTLLLLDSNVEGNQPEDRELTARLYGGDERVRIRQELLLGVGGVRALTALGIAPGVLHLNEGHSAHTPVPAGHDRFTPALVEEHLGPLRESLGVDRERFLGLGRVNTSDSNESSA
jgi:starch phosphorylase